MRVIELFHIVFGDCLLKKKRSLYEGTDFTKDKLFSFTNMLVFYALVHCSAFSTIDIHVYTCIHV